MEQPAPSSSSPNWLSNVERSQRPSDTGAVSDKKRMRLVDDYDYNYFKTQFERKRHLDESDLCDLVECLPFNVESKMLFEHCLRSGVNLNCMRKDRTSLLFKTAVRLRSEAWVECMLHFGADPKHAVKHYEDGFMITATDIAWRNQDTKIVWHFLRFDGPFPENFSLVELSTLQGYPRVVELKALVESRIDLHRFIIENNTRSVEYFITQNPRLKCAYDSNNQCALTTALKAKNFVMYALLRSFGYTHGLDSSHNEIMSTLTDYDKASLRKEIHFKTANLYVLDLVSMSQLGMDNEPANFRRVQAMFEALDRIEIFQPIVKLVASAKNLRIVFDFKNSSICELDPTSCNDDHIKGRAYELSREIFVGAKRDSDFETLGTLAHEMTHYALLMVFNNSFLPYHEDDIGSEHEMNEVFEACCQVQNKNRLISHALSYQDTVKQHAELIVRVPQLMALYSEDSNALAGIRKNYAGLFNFFENQVMPVLKREVPFIKPRQRMQEVNKFLGVYAALKYQTYTCDDHKLKFHEVNGSEHVYIQTNVPKMMLRNLMMQFNLNSAREANADHIFVKVEQLLDPKIMDTALELLSQLPNSRMFILDDTEVDEELMKKSLGQAIKNAKIFFVTTKSDADMKKWFTQCFEVKIEWNDISPNSKSRLLKKGIVLQSGQDVVPIDFAIKTDSKAIQKCPVEELIKPGALLLKDSHHLHPESPAAYVLRKFEKMSEGSGKVLTEQELKEILKTERTVIIADAAGMGKTVSAKSFMNRFRDPSWWPVFIDLKQHTEVFLQDHEEQPEKISEEWFSKTLLKMGLLEQSLFEVFFEGSHILFIIDGFDEISPNFKNFVIAILTTIRESQNMLMVTTRLHLAKELEIKLKTIPIKSVPFSENDQLSYLEMLLLKNVTELGEREDKAKQIFKKIKKTFTKRDFLKVPLHMTMLVEVLDQTRGDHLYLNVYQLYDKFFTKKIGIWNYKGPLASDDNTIIQVSTLNIRQIHQKVALEYFFGAEAIEPLCLPEIEETITGELISRIGLLMMAQNGEILFSHQTFAEYLVAEYIFSGIISKSFIASSDALQLLFISILLEEKYEGIRKFMNDRLQVVDKVLQVEKFCKKFEESLKQQENREILYRMINEEKTNLMTFVLKTLKLSDEARLNLIRHKLANQNEALHYSQDYSSSFRTLWNCIEDFADINTQKELLAARGFANRNVLSQSVLIEDVLRFILEKILATMTDKEFLHILSQKDQIQNTVILRTSTKHFPAFEIIWNAVARKLNPTDQKKVLFAVGEYDRNILHQMTLYNNSDGLQFALNVCEKLCTNEELRDFVFHVTSFGNTAVHRAARWSDFEVFAVIWKFVGDNFKVEDQKSLMLLENQDGWNFLMEALHSDFELTKHCVKNEAEHLLGTEDYQKALVVKFEENETMLHIVFQSGSFEQVTSVLQQVCLERDMKAIESLILAKDCLNQHVLHSLSFNKVHPVAEVAWKFVVENLEPEKVKMLLLAKAQNGDNAVISAAENGSKLLVNILEWFHSNFGSEQTKNVFQLRFRESRALMHVISKYCNACLVQQLLDFTSSALATGDLQALLQDSDSTDMTIIDYALRNNRDSSTVNVVWNTLKATLDPNDFDKMRLEHERRLPPSVMRDIMN